MGARGWQKVVLGDVVESFDHLRVPVKEADRRPGQYPYYGASGVIDHVDDFIFDGEYLLIAEDGENLRTRKTPIAFLTNGRFWVNNHAHIVRGKDVANTRYLLYALQQVNVEAFLTGSTMPKLTQANLQRIPLALPSLREQTRIAALLGCLDDKIDLNRRMNQTLEAMAQALFRSWFVDFDPVRAKAAGRQPEGMDAETAALFPRGLDDGGCPAGWSLGQVADVCALNARQLSRADELAELEYIEISGVMRGDVLERARYQRGAEPSRARRRVSHGDTLLSTVRPDRGSYLLALEPPEELVVSTGFAVLTPQSVPWSFLFAALTREEVFERLGQLADGGAYPAVRPCPSAGPHPLEG